MKGLTAFVLALLIGAPMARAASVRIGTSHSEGERYLGGTEQDLGYLSEETQGLSVKGGSYAENNAWSLSLDHYRADLSKAMQDTLGLAKETWQVGASAQLSGYLKLTYGNLSIDGGDGDIFTSNAHYLNIYPYTAEHYRNRLVIGMERDTAKNGLSIVTFSHEIDKGYLLFGYSEYAQTFQHSNNGRTDQRWAAAVTIPFTDDRSHYWIAGGGSDGYYPSQLAGVSGALGESNDYLLVRRERIRRSSKGEPMATQFTMANLNFGGYGHYLILPEFFPGLLKTSKIISNKDVGDEVAPRGPGGLLDLPTFSLVAMMLRVELTKTSELVVNNLQVYYKPTDRVGWAVKPHLGVAFNEQSDIFFDYKEYKLSDSVARSADLILGGGVSAWDTLLEMQAIAGYDLDRSKLGRVRLAFSTAF